MSKAASPKGWYQDPYAVHEDRWCSEARPTPLVRDGHVEFRDAPPDLPLPEDLEPSSSEVAPLSGSGTRRADDAQRGSGFDQRRAVETAAYDISVWGPMP